jgi:flagellar biosynthesis/type III secretory pathway protein FliH
MQQGMLQGMQQGMLQGMQQGMQQGMHVGKLAGETDMLCRVLVRRFGPLSAAVQAQINAAGAEQIRVWFDRSLDADDLAHVFASH